MASQNSHDNAQSDEQVVDEAVTQPVTGDVPGPARTREQQGSAKKGGSKSASRKRTRQAPAPTREVEPYMYFTERDLDQILANLDHLRETVFPNMASEGQTQAGRQQYFPSVCLIGLGRCGSNIALDVAALVHSARSFYLQELDNEEKRAREKEVGPLRWIRKSLNLPTPNTVKPVFLIEPMVMLGDLDKDIEGRIHFSNRGGNHFIDDYNKMKIMDLSEVHAGGGR